MKFNDTAKLFYKKFVYKLEIPGINPYQLQLQNFRNYKLGILREYRRLKEGRNYISETALYRKIKSKEHYSLRTFLKINFTLANLLQQHSGDYKIVTGYQSMFLYTNNDQLYNDLVNFFTVYFDLAVTRPKNEKIKNFLLDNPNAIVNNTTNHRYKVTFKSLSKKDSNELNKFIEWANNTKNVKIRNYYFDYDIRYFYVDDYKSISMCQIMVGNLIRRVQEFVTEDMID